MLKIIAISVVILHLFQCQNTESNSNKKMILGALLLSRPKSLGKGSQALASYFADTNSLIAEDSVESGSSGATGGTRSFSATIENGNGTITISNEEFNCKYGGSVIFNGTQTISVNSRVSPEVFTLELSNTYRKLQYNNCRVSRSLTINSGELTIEQKTPSTILISELDLSDGKNIVRRTLQNLSSEVKGNLNLTLSGSRGSGTANIEIEQNLVITRRIREWSLFFGRLRTPNLKLREGNVIGTLKINDNLYTINKSLDVNVEDD
jgi:hypothetical protein